MIVADGIGKTFDDVVAVEALNLDIAAGEVFGFLGPNGAGKTTTIRMLTSLIAPTTGTAMVAGYRIGKDDREIRRRVGILTESPGLYDRLSAARNLEIFARLYEVQDVAGQIERYLRMQGLWERRHDATATFSKGMKQKLAIARALLHEPRVLFLDEPTAGLDPEAAKLVRDFVADLQKQGRTIFLCTHNLDEAERLCDRIAVFNRQLRVVDTPAGLRHKLYGRRVVFHLAEAGQSLRTILDDLPYVERTEAVDNKLLVDLEDPERHNPQMIRLLVDAGADIQFVGELRHSLEDIYLQLVGQE